MSTPKYPEENSLVVVRADRPSQSAMGASRLRGSQPLRPWPVRTHTPVPHARTHAHAPVPAAGVLTLEFKLSSAVRLPTEKDLISHADFE